MKCPYCGYEHGFSHEITDTIEGEDGGFYTLSNDVNMTRKTSFSFHANSKEVYGCPSCSKIFMDI